MTLTATVDDNLQTTHIKYDSEASTLKRLLAVMHLRRELEVEQQRLAQELHDEEFNKAWA